MTERVQIGADGTEIGIRGGRPSDVGAILNLVRESYGQYVAAEGSKPAPMTADYAHQITEAKVWVATREDAVVGLLVLENMGDHLLLENVAVAAPCRGIGIGRQLLEFAEVRARGLGLGEIRLYTGRVMTQNLHYYPRHGYVETHRSLEDGHHRVYFTKVLAPG